MIRVIPDWLQDAVDFLNREFPEDTDVNVSILYGFDSVGIDENNCGFAVYNTETNSIMIADYNELKNSINDLSWEDVKDTTITNLFHEYRHHQQNTYNWDFDEEDAEVFANHMYKEYLSQAL